jgi:hypothetical protein
MALWAICAAAQPPQQLQPSIFDGGFRLMPSPHKISVTPMKNNDSGIKNAQTNASPKRSELPTYEVECNLDFNEEYQTGLEIRIFNKEEGESINNPTKGSNILSVPEGTYDIMAIFGVIDTISDYPQLDHILVVVREQVTINQNMQLDFSADEAKNHIHFQTLTLEGEPVYTGRWHVDENWNWTPLDLGNTDNLYYFNKLYHTEYTDLQTGYILSLDGSYGVCYEGAHNSPGGEAFGDFYINDVSERYVFHSYRIGINGRDAFTSSYEVQGATDDVTVENDPSKYKEFADPFLVPKYQDEDLFQIFCVWEKAVSANGASITNIAFTEPITEGQAIRCYVGASPEDSKVGFAPFIQPQISVKRTGIMPWGLEEEYYKPVMMGIPLTNSNGEAAFANNGIRTHKDTNGLFYPDRYPDFTFEACDHIEELWGDYVYKHTEWPAHPAFAYPVAKKIGNLGNNCPLLVSQIDMYGYGDSGPVSDIAEYMDFIFGYLGRYGEKKHDDQSNANINTSYNGDLLFEGQGCFSSQLNEPLNGMVDATIINEEFLVDDMAGSNKAHLQFNAGAEDMNPPTMTMLHFKDANENVTDRFATAAEGCLEFSAGDFNKAFSPLGYPYYNRYAPESVDVSYSPYGEDNWNELAVEEVPENYWPVMGWFYTSSLASVMGEGLNGWFDLKIRLTDAAGNWQEQVLSPAFRIDDHAYSSVASVGSSNAHEVARYNLAGQRVDANATGAVIIKMSDGTARKVIN